MAPRADDDSAPCELPALHGGSSVGTPPYWWIRDSLQALTKGVNVATTRVNQIEENLTGQIATLSEKVAELATQVNTLVTQASERQPAQLEVNSRVRQLPTPEICRECQELAVAVRTGRVAQMARSTQTQADNSTVQTLTARQALWVGLFGGGIAAAGVVVALLAWLRPFAS